MNRCPSCHSANILQKPRGGWVCHTCANVFPVPDTLGEPIKQAKSGSGVIAPRTYSKAKAWDKK